jgi:arabinose-5-phosphate isomerase
MRGADDAPAVHTSATMMEAVREITRGRLGMTAILDDDRHVIGVFTDGDLRRTLEKGHDFESTPVAAVMTRGPHVIAPDRLAVEAVEIMERHKINQLLVVDAGGRLVGALNMHDLFRAKVI